MVRRFRAVKVGGEGTEVGGDETRRSGVNLVLADSSTREAPKTIKGMQEKGWGAKLVDHPWASMKGFPICESHHSVESFECIVGNLVSFCLLFDLFNHLLCLSNSILFFLTHLVESVMVTTSLTFGTPSFFVGLVL